MLVHEKKNTEYGYSQMKKKAYFNVQVACCASA